MSEARDLSVRVNVNVSVNVNGEDLQVPASGELREALRLLGFDPSAGGFAVAIDGEVVPRSEWSRTVLRGGENLEIVRAVQGG